MQIQYDRARALGYTGPAAGLLDPETNIYLGAKFLRQLLDKFRDTRDAISGYNAGPNGVVHPYINKKYVTAVYTSYVVMRTVNDLGRLAVLFLPAAILTGILELKGYKND